MSPRKRTARRTGGHRSPQSPPRRALAQGAGDAPPSSDVPAARGRQHGLLAAVALAMLAAGTAWGVSLVTARGARTAVLARLAVLPDLSAKPVAMRRALDAADRAARQAARGDAAVDTGRAAGALGRLYHANAYGAHAAQSYQVAMELDTDNPRWPYYLAVLRQEKGDTASATQLLERAVALAPGYAPAWLRLADTRFKQGHTERARAGYQRRLDLSPGDPYAHLGLARVALAASGWDSAETHLRSAIATDPSFDPAHRLLASVHEHFGRSQEMSAALARADDGARFAAAPDPWVDRLLDECFDVEWLLLHVSKYAYAAGGHIAQTLIDRAMMLGGDNPEVYLVFGQYARSPAEARQAYETAIALDPEHADAHALLGEALVMMNEPTQAEPVLRTALALGATTASTYKNLGLTLAATGRFDEAIEYIEQALARQPESVAAQYSRASILRTAGRTEEARLQYQKLLAQRPSHAAAAAGLDVLMRTATQTLR